MAWRWTRADALGDAALLAALGTGDVDAATAFVRRFQRRVYGLALTITLDADIADDVAQASFERAWRHAASYDPRRAPVATWLLTITRNLAIDTVRIRRPAPVDPAELAALLPPASGGDAADPAVEGDRLAKVVAALERLPEEQRRAVVLATVMCRSSREIAEIEGVPIPTAKHRIQAGLRKLRRSLVAAADQ